ncbi:MAG: type III-A CRISPR-associated RAMP protein Csm4 [Armatimonadota bacterium]|nr:type III-A CRISPR-associated RAMP protein Csm4 [Armatimonadota bacterium]MDR7437066.1 type III-A CRISPR-associated RAMP protein Csm4 [Armatimonadota bacterium]MDR7507247.1 type III-A CRISPR-associated RAMP protein Csm4 [Armatimonadota bacterium]MDR7508952.1 type III-A CRISPR-associated RAMP protein Csm4 [Armatimonadota bacterium]MDR7583666.1 type III-A CRISPR-associated RAMP protein Csm4 [Armatimonadota bacterium]
MSLYRVLLTPRSAFHLGERGIGYEETSELVHADTLFSALCSVWTLLFGEDAVRRDLLPDGPNWEPPLRISSAFPRAGPVRFYPKPLLPSPDGDATRWKEVEWLSESLFIAWLGGARVPQFTFVHDGTVALAEAEREKLAHDPTLPFWKTVRVPRVTLDAVSKASELWHFGRLHFAPGCGLHFWVELRGLEDRFWTALRLLGDVGLGGDRSAGHGLFDVEFRQEEPPWKASDSRFVTLSPVYLPEAQAGVLLRNGCAYRLEMRPGWIGAAQPSPYRRKAVRLLAEGSVLTGSTGALWGGFVDVTPEGVPDLPHRVYRWGYAFPAGVIRP